MRERSIPKFIRVNEYENEIIKQKMQQSGYADFQMFALKMLIFGEIKVIDQTPLKEIAYQLSKIGNNVNQIAHFKNLNNKVSKKDLDYLVKEFSDLKKDIRKILKENQEEAKEKW